MLNCSCVHVRIYGYVLVHSPKMKVLGAGRYQMCRVDGTCIHEHVRAYICLAYYPFPVDNEKPFHNLDKRSKSTWPNDHTLGPY